MRTKVEYLTTVQPVYTQTWSNARARALNIFMQYRRNFKKPYVLAYFYQNAIKKFKKFKTTRASGTGF